MRINRGYQCPGDSGRIVADIDATHAEIDRLVYDLYGLTAEKIALVEEANA